MDKSRPDPAVDLVGSIRWIMDHIEALERSEADTRLSATAAAKAFNFGPRYLHGKPWRVPGFGLQGHLHTRATWEAWLARPETERRAEWDAMPVRERKLARGINA